MIKYVHKPKGICAERIEVTLSDDGHIIHDVQIVGACAGNADAIRKMILELAPYSDKVINTLLGNKCGNKPTSCGDQLAIALQKALEQVKSPVTFEQK